MSFRSIIDVEVSSLLIDAPVPEVQPDIEADIADIDAAELTAFDVPIELLLIDANVFNPNLGTATPFRQFFDLQIMEFFDGDDREFL